VQAATKKSRSLQGTVCSSNARTFRQVFELMEGDAGFDGATDVDGDSVMSEEL
jgi:hypothetical protein